LATGSTVVGTGLISDRWCGSRILVTNGIGLAGVHRVAAQGGQVVAITDGGLLDELWLNVGYADIRPVEAATEGEQHGREQHGREQHGRYFVCGGLSWR
jgi:NAD(P)-dependent dehydrogenase (short-subunit alcohol dehydrogenase family)